MSKGFTLIEVIVSLAVIAVLSAVVLFTMNQYIKIGKDSNLAGTLASLIPAGEIFYNGNNNSYYRNDSGEISFCNPSQNSVLRNVISQMPEQVFGAPCYGATTPPYELNSNPAGVCCYAEADAWVAYARVFANDDEIYCVDSRGIRKNTDKAQIPNIDFNFKCLP